ncbi:MAG TPA: hypothetical protein VNC50_19745 [Planctomycetia bacterium]|nr:hypothetical protein [Planctomycetia bacterium]
MSPTAVSRQAALVAAVIKLVHCRNAGAFRGRPPGALLVCGYIWKPGRSLVVRLAASFIAGTPMRPAFPLREFPPEAEGVRYVIEGDAQGAD